MAKEPRAGRVKTRLGRDIGMARAAWWFRHRLVSLSRELQSARWHTVLAVSPDRAVLSPSLPALPRLAQGSGSLGERMDRLFRSLPPGPVIIIGADIPGITKNHIKQGFSQLGRHDAIIGPAADGGYWAIGLKRMRAPPPGMFRGVRWSSEHAMADTLATIPDLSLGLLPVLSDVDVGLDFSRL